MLKLLLKKQLYELNLFYFQNGKTGKRRSKAGIILMGILFAFIFISVMSVFFSVAFLFASTMLDSGFMAPTEGRWLYFAMMSVITLLLGVFGSVFNTYASLYKAKDNEILLSMPIPPSKILLVRMLGVCLMSALYTAIAWIPTSVCYWITVFPSIGGFVFPILMFFVLTLLVTVLTCLMGWIVALIASRMKGKNFVVVIITVVLFAAYYYVVFNMNNLIGKLMISGDIFRNVIYKRLYPIYLIGRGAAGHLPSFILALLMAAAVFTICYVIMSKTFISIITRSGNEKKTVYKEKAVKSQSIDRALLGRELKHFASNATYMLNGGLGIVIMLAAAVFAFIKMDYIHEMIAMISAELPGIVVAIPTLIVAAVIMISSMDVISAPSVSLEGKTIWLAQTLPVPTWSILHAKENLHVLLNSVPAVVCTIALGIVFEVEIPTIVLMAVAVWMNVWFTADWGLFLNLKRPNLNWKNEAYPIKQSMSVFVVLFGGWLIAACVGFAYLPLAKYLDVRLYLTIWIAIFIGAYQLVNRWIRRKGVVIFENL